MEKVESIIGCEWPGCPKAAIGKAQGDWVCREHFDLIRSETGEATPKKEAP